MANRNDPQYRGGQNYQNHNDNYSNRNQMGSSGSSGYPGQPGQGGQHSAYQDNRGQVSGYYGAEGNFPGSQQHGGFDVQNNMRGNEGSFSSSYGGTLHGDQGYGPQYANENAARYGNPQRGYGGSYGYGRSQAYGGPQGSWDDAYAGWRGGLQNYGGASRYGHFQGGYEQGEPWQGSHARDYGQGGQGHQFHDPEYCQWRNEQIRSLDDAYAAWRDERYSKFSKEFGEWRKNHKEKEGASDSEQSHSSATGKSK